MTIDRIRNASLMCAVKTPYLNDGGIDLAAYDNLVEKLKQGGVQGLIVGGTTGEGHLMSWDEQIMLIAHSVNKFGNDMIIVGNTGSNNTREALHATLQGFAVGMHAALQINPYYGKTSTKGLLEHFGRVLGMGPAIIYNVPGRTGQDIQPAVIEELSKHLNFAGVKECSGNERIHYYEDQGIACWSGNDDQSIAGRHECKSHGVISVTANVVPSVMRKLMDAPDAELEARVKPLMSWMFCEPNPIPLNTMLAMTGLAKPVFRLPYAPLSQDKRAEGLKLLEAFAAEEVVGTARNLLKDEEFLLV